MSSTAPAPAPRGRIAQIRETYRLTRKADPALPWVLLAVFLDVYFKNRSA